MKYRNISLNNNHHCIYSLIKYNDDCKEYLEEFKDLNKDLADAVIKYPEIYDESSEHQSYLIFRGSHTCVGAIKIETSSDEKDLEVELQLNERYLKQYKDRIELTEQIIESLKLYFYDKENIEIRLFNNTDLSKFNCIKYRKKIYDENLTTYTTSNKEKNQLISKLIDEISETKKRLKDEGFHWNEDFDSKETYYYFDRELIEEIEIRRMSFPELFSKVEKYSLINIFSPKAHMDICFSRNGQIGYSRHSYDRENGIDSTVSYNVLNDSFNLYGKKAYDKRKEGTQIHNDSYSTIIKTNGLNIYHYKEDNVKRYIYTTPIENNSSISVEMWTDEQNEIKSCYIDFRTHKSNGKVNGFFALRIAPARYDDTFSLRFISRKGNRYGDFTEEIFNKEEELYSNIIEGKLTYELIDELIEKVIPIINKRASIYNKQPILINNTSPISNLIEAEANTISLIKEIKNESSLQHLEESLDTFIDGYNKIQKDNKETVLK